MESALGFIAFITFLLIVALAINAGLLMLATRLAGIRVPSFGRAVLIVIVAGLVLGVVRFVLTMIVEEVVGGRLDPSSPTFALIAASLSILLTLFVNAWIYSAMLPTSYIKGLIVYIIQVAVIIAIVVSIALTIALVSGGFAFMNHA